MELIDLSSRIDLSSTPLLISGDSNEILLPFEHSNCCSSSITPPMAEFRDFLLQIGVFDLRFNEPLHTWTNSKSDTLIANKLD